MANDTPQGPAPDLDVPGATYARFLSDVAGGAGTLPPFLDATVAGVETERHAVSRNEYYRLSGKDRSPDYAPVFRGVASASAGLSGGEDEESDNFFKRLIDRKAEQFIISWDRMVNGPDSKYVSGYTSREDALVEFAGNVLPAAGAALGLAALGVPVATVLAGSLAVGAGVNAFFLAGASDRELNNMDSAWTVLTDWRGFVPDDPELRRDMGYWERFGRAAAAETLDAVTLGAVFKGAGAGIRKLKGMGRAGQAGERAGKLSRAYADDVYLTRSAKRGVRKELVADDANLEATLAQEAVLDSSRRAASSANAYRKLKTFSEGVDEATPRDFAPVQGRTGAKGLKAKTKPPKHPIPKEDVGDRGYKLWAAEGAERAFTRTGDMAENLDAYIKGTAKYETTPLGGSGKVAGKTSGSKMGKALEPEGTAERLLVPPKETGSEYVEYAALKVKLENLRIDDFLRGAKDPLVGGRIAKALEVTDLAMARHLTKAGGETAMGNFSRTLESNLARTKKHLDDALGKLSEPGITARGEAAVLKEVETLRGSYDKILRGIGTEGGTGADYLGQLAARAYTDSLLGIGALATAAAGNTIQFTFETAVHLLETSAKGAAVRDIGRASVDFATTLGKYIPGGGEWSRIWREASKGSGVGKRFDVAIGASPPAEGAGKKIANVLTGFNLQLLREVDRIMTGGMKRLIARKALENTVELAERRGLNLLDLKKDFVLASKGKQPLPPSFLDDYSRMREEIGAKWTLRADRADDAPALAKLAWGINDMVSTFSKNPNQIVLFRVLGKTVAPFTRVAANITDQAVRATPLTVVGEGGLKRLAESKARVLLGTLAGAELYSRSNLKVPLIGSRDHMTGDSFKSRSAGFEPSVSLGGRVVPLSTVGPLGMVVEAMHYGVTSARLLGAEGDGDGAAEAARMATGALNLALADNFLSSSVTPFFLSLARGFKEGNFGDRFEKEAVRFVPGKAVFDRFVTAQRGYRPSDTAFFDTLNGLTEDLPTALSDQFGDRFDGSADSLDASEEIGMGVSLGLFLNPGWKKHQAHKEELRSWLVRTGMTSGEKNILHVTKSGKSVSLPLGVLKDKYVAGFNPLGRTVVLPGTGATRISQKDYHRVLGLMSLRKDYFDRTAEKFQEALNEAGPYDPETASGSEYFERAAILRYDIYADEYGAKRDAFSGYVPNEMLRDKDKGLSHFLHHAATAEELAPFSKAEVEFYKEAIEEGLLRNVPDTPGHREAVGEISELLARRALVARMLSSVQEYVRNFARIAPSVVENLRKRGRK